MKRRILILAAVIGLMGGFAVLPAGAGHNPNHRPKPTTTTTSTTTTTVPPTTTTTTTTPPPECGPPIVVTAGGTYSGCYRSTDPAVPAVLIQTTAPVTLSRARIEHAGQGVRAYWDYPADLDIQDSVFQQLQAPRSQRAVYVYNFQRFIFEHNELVDGAGVRLASPDRSPTQVSVRYNKATNIGRYGDGYEGGGGELLQFFTTTLVDMAGPLEVAWNEVHNQPLLSDVEDVINFYDSKGLPTSPFDVHHNLIDGAYPETLGVSYGKFTGSGTVLGDFNGSYQRAHHNYYVSTTNAGPSIPAGDHLEVYENVSVNDGYANGVLTGSDWENGVTLWDNPSYAVPPTNNSVHDNNTGWMRPHVGGGASRSDYWFPVSPEWPVGCGNNGNTCFNNASMPDPVDASDEQAARDQWAAAATAAGVTTGPRPLADPEPGPITGLSYQKVFDDDFNSLSPTWVEFPWYPARNGHTVENGSLWIRTKPFDPFPVGNEVTTLGPRSDTFPHYPQAKTWQGPDVYFEARFRYTNNPWTVPAFWLYSVRRANTFPAEPACPITNPEWDIVEGNIAQYGADRLSTQGLHKNTNSYCGIPDQVQVEWTPDHGSGLSDWHVWSGHWTGTELIQYLDGVEQSRMPHNGWLDDQMFLILHIDEGSTTPPGNPPKAWGYDLEVDYVEVWKKP